MLIKYREELGLSKVGLCLLMVMAAGFPQAAEVWANSINLHFHFALVAAIIAALPAKTEKNPKLTIVLQACVAA